MNIPQQKMEWKYGYFTSFTPPYRGVGKRTQASKPLAKALRALAKALSRGVYTFTKMFQNLIFSLYVLV